jgi:hypothetical protein
MRVMLEPGQPRWPPRPVFNRFLGGPSLWVGILGVSCAMQNPVMPVSVAGLADDAGIVATAGQDKGHVLVIDQIELVNGLSRLTAQRDLFSSDQEPTSRPTDQPPPPAPLLSSSGPPKSRDYPPGQQNPGTRLPIGEADLGTSCPTLSKLPSFNRQDVSRGVRQTTSVSNTASIGATLISVIPISNESEVPAGATSQSSRLGQGGSGVLTAVGNAKTGVSGFQPGSFRLLH